MHTLNSEPRLTVMTAVCRSIANAASGTAMSANPKPPTDCTKAANSITPSTQAISNGLTCGQLAALRRSLPRASAARQRGEGFVELCGMPADVFFDMER